MHIFCLFHLFGCQERLYLFPQFHEMGSMILLVNAVDFARSHSSFFWKSKIEHSP